MNECKLLLKEKTCLFMNLFAGLKHVYGSYNIKTGKTYQVKAPVDFNVIAKHLWGYHSYGVYPLMGKHTNFIAIDIDTNDLTLVSQFYAVMNQYYIPLYIERSKSKGYHLWIFFDQLVSAHKARLVVYHVINTIGCGAIEVFPKRDGLDDNVSYGNFINAPLFYPFTKVQRTVFINPENGYQPFEDQWQVLSHIQKISEIKLGCLIEKLGLNSHSKFKFSTGSKISSHGYYTLPPCKQKMLEYGVTQYQRLACYRIAISLKCAGMPFDKAVYTLKSWALKNRPSNNKRIITEKEIIAQTQSAYKGKYRNIGCECPSVVPFCDNTCQIKNSFKHDMGDNIMNKPKKRVRCGAISASIWTDQKTINGKEIEYHSISISKTYKDGDEWKHTNNFDTKDLCKIAIVAIEAYKLIEVSTSDLPLSSKE